MNDTTDTQWGNAKWIWPYRANTQNHNTYAQFRYDFDAEATPATASLLITADQLYALYVNGEYVGRGPARGYQASWPYDEYDVSKHLRHGHNWISILAYNAGISTYQYIHQSAAGVLCAATLPAVQIASGGKWKCRLAPGYRQDTARTSFQTTYQEWLDKRLNNNDWIAAPEYNQEGWREPAAVERGSMPWHALEPRGIPHLTSHIVPYARVAATGTGECGPAWRDELFPAVFAEARRGAWKAGEKKGNAAELPATTEEKFAAACFDLGRPGVGMLNVRVRGARGGEVLDLFFTEGLTDEHAPLTGPNVEAGSGAKFVTRLVLAQGPNEHECFQLMGHRYVTAIARDTRTPLTVEVSLRETVYPMKVTGSFSCSDTTLNDIHRISVQTQRVCAMDAYVDTPWREQTQWWGDARVQAQNTFHLCADTRLLVRGVRCIARQEVPNGLTYGHAPTRAHGSILPDFTLIWLLTIWDYYFQTGDVSLYVEQSERIDRVLGYFRGEGRHASSGLLRYDPRYWLFLDWCDIEKEGCPALLNLWYMLALQKLGDLARTTGDERKADALEQEAARHGALVESAYWDPDAGLYRDCIAPDGSPSSRHSAHTQTLAIICGLAGDRAPALIETCVLPWIRGERGEGAQPGSYWTAYVHELLHDHGHGEEALRHIQAHWAHMIPLEGTAEEFVYDTCDPTTRRGIPGQLSFSHAWSAHPIYSLARIVGGVRQTGPGWSEIRYAPHAGALDLTWADVTVPTPHGPIRSRWKQNADGSFETHLDCPAEVRVLRP